MKAALKSLLASATRGSLSRNTGRILLRKRCQSVFRNARHPRYHSQHGQDLFLDNFVFHGKREGTFVDIGAYDGVTLSNTCFFERELAWSGICVEPNPQAFSILRSQRRASCLNAGISDSGGELDFLQLPGDLALGSGFRKFYTPDSDFARHQPQGASVISVPTKRIMDLFDEHDLRQVDYLSVDTEGADYAIITAIDFGRCFIGAISVENGSWDEKIAVHLSRYGYELAAVLGADEIYVHSEYAVG